ncbi:universal stress protein [Amphritea sp. HPY]|uniref:universal stress protein n=1 Tax=Amphritea sp. HPY TaxID=3421652 RepID=UPI003D7E28A9
MFNKILVPIDLQDLKGAQETLKSVKDYANGNMQIELLSVLPGYSMPLVASYFPKDMVKQALDAMRKELSKLAEDQLGDAVKYDVWVTAGKAARRIVKRAAEIDAELILIRAQKHGAIEHAMMGSVTAKVVETANCSVLVLK